MSGGVVVDWDLMFKTWDHVLNRELFLPDSVAGVHRPFPQVAFTHSLGEAVPPPVLPLAAKRGASLLFSFSFVCFD